MARPKISVTMVERLIASQFPEWTGLTVRRVQPSGWDNLTFRLGDDLVVRMPSAERYAGQVHREQRWLPSLARSLPVPICELVAIGQPDFEYPWSWSILRWIPGEAARMAQSESAAFAEQLAEFLTALHRIDAASGPTAGADNFHRGGRLTVYDPQVRAALARRGNPADEAAIWQTALTTTRRQPAVWVHGDIAPGNLIVADKRLAGVIDWGNCAVGDPACDLAIAWAFFRGASRRAFRAALPFDEATWARARGWALWKALILTTGVADGPAEAVADAPRALREVLA